MSQSKPKSAQIRFHPNHFLPASRAAIKVCKPVIREAQTEPGCEAVRGRIGLSSAARKRPAGAVLGTPREVRLTETRKQRIADFGGSAGWAVVRGQVQSLNKNGADCPSICPAGTQKRHF